MSTQFPLWQILALLAVAAIFSSAHGWAADQYEFRRSGIVRRWYGTNAHVCLRSAEDDDDAERYTVVAWDDEGTDVPWLLVEAMDDDWTAHWAPVTDFAPYTVRRLRPHILRSEHHRFPQLFDYRPLRQPHGFLGGVRDAA